MKLSKETLESLRTYLNFIEPKAIDYREELKRIVPPEKLQYSLPLIYTTDRPYEPILPITASYSGQYNWRPQLIDCCLPFPFTNNNWYEQVAKPLREKLASDLTNDLPIPNEQIEKYKLSNKINNLVNNCIDSSSRRYLAIVIIRGTAQRENAFQIVAKQINTRFDPEECIEYIGCYLYNFLLDPLIDSVDLSPKIKIRKTTFGDIEREVFNIGQYTWNEGDFLPPEYMLTVQLDKVPFYQTFLGYTIPINKTEIENIISTLRLHQPNYLGYNRIIGWSEGIPLSLSSVENDSTDRFIHRIFNNHVNFPKYELKIDQIDEIKKLLQNILSETIQNKLKIALVRFNASYKWTDGRERIIDLVVALENIFGEETVGQTTEVGYRLRMRAARFLGNNDESRKYLMGFFSNIYMLRSKIVHGDSQDVDTLINKKFNKTLDEVITETEDYLRKSLRKIIENPLQMGQEYFNKLLLGNID
jgi:hypothetical protein